MKIYNNFKRYIKTKIYHKEFLKAIKHYNGPNYPSQEFPVKYTSNGPKLVLIKLFPNHFPVDCYNDIYPPKIIYALKYSGYHNPSKLFLWAQKHL